MSERDDERVRISQVLAGALAAVTAALIGSTMGVAGTVVGAGLASVISTVGGTLYLRSIQRTRDSVRTVRAKVVGRSGGATVLVSTDDEEPAPETGDEVDASASEEPVAEDRPPAEKRRLRWPVLVVTTVAAFALGMVAVTGVEWLRGESLSGGSGTTFGSVVAPRGSSNDTDDRTGETTSTTTPTTTTTTPTGPTTTTAPTTTSTTPPSDSTTTTTTTTTPPVTTTTEATPSGGSIPPGN
jgi:hypothetical protein